MKQLTKTNAADAVNCAADFGVMHASGGNKLGTIRAKWWVEEG